MSELSDGPVKQWVADADAHELQIAIHAIGDRANDEVLKITVEEALRCYTANNAYGVFREQELGRIAPGMLADVAVLSDDVFTIAPERIEHAKVDITIFDGHVIYERK
jgi:predicted amidohydrolase YtcJ